MKASPGPWKALIGEDNQHEFERPEGVWGTVIDRNDFHVCRIWDDVAELHEPEANANLIAAAHDLLEALKEALKDSGCDGDLCCHWWHEAARAAIAKAEGGAE